jgi:hypothetical protein
VNKLKKILKKYDYLIEVIESDKGCVILTPENFFGFYRPPQIRAYNIVKDPEKPGVSVCSNLHDTIFVPIPRYVIASAITWDVIKTCKQYEYDVSLVHFVDIGGNYCEDLDFSDKLDLSDKEKYLKLILDNTFLNQVKTDFKIDVSKELKQFGICEGYEILVKLFRSDDDE